MTVPLQIRVDSNEFRAQMARLRAFDKKLYAQTRKRMREAANPVVADIKSKLATGGGSTDTGMRSAIASGTRSTIALGKKAGVTITSTSRALPANKKAMLRAWNKSTFRHPIFGTGVWVTQAGNPYFLRVIMPHRADFQRAALRALQDALRQVE